VHRVRRKKLSTNYGKYHRWMKVDIIIFFLLVLSDDGKSWYSWEREREGEGSLKGDFFSASPFDSWSFKKSCLDGKKLPFSSAIM